jgi:hypothetical protein
MSEAGADADCVICERLRGDPPPGGWVHADQHFVVGVSAGAEIPGWLMIHLRRHVPPITSELSDAEARALGPLLKRLCAAIETTTGAARVYQVVWGEYLPHWTMLLAVRGEEIGPEGRRVELIANRARYVDVEAAAAAARRVAAVLAESAG